MDAELVDKALPLAPDTVLRNLAAASAGAVPTDRPVVRLGLTSGHVTEGRLISVGTDRTDEVVVLGVPPHRHKPPESAAYLRMRDVVSAVVVDPELFRDVLSGGVLPAPVAGPPVSRLALRREYADLPLRVDWDSLPDSAAATSALALLLAAVRAAASGIREDDAGRLAWAAIGSVRVVHRPGAGLAVDRVPEGVVISTDFTAALPRRLDLEVAHRLAAAL